MAEVKLVNVKKIYPFISGEEKKKSKKKKDDEPVKEKANLQITDKGVVAVQEFNLDIADKEFIVLVGPSGCGKSTTLRMIAGLEEITEGELYIDGKLVNDVAPKDRDIAMVFQNYALYPHMTVYDNMAFSLKLKKVPKAEIDRKVKEAAECLKMTAADLLRLGVVERVVPEKGRDFDELSASLGQALADKLAEKRALPVEDLLRARYDRFRKIGG